MLTRIKFALLLFAITFATNAWCEKLSFQRAVELAMANSTTAAIGAADQARARQGYYEARNQYVPQLVVGSGLAKSVGFPMSIEGSAPSVFQLNMQSFLYNPAQREFLRAARTEWNASTLSAEDQRKQAAGETALTYVQLQRTIEKMDALRALADQALKTEAILRERFQEGMASRVEVTRAALSSARTRLRIADAQTSADLLRLRLAQLTGLSADAIETDGTSIPQYPDSPTADVARARALENNSALKASETRAEGKALQAKGEHKQNRPAVDLVGSYGLFTKYNNYEDFFRRFERNNATFGVQIRFPFFNLAQRSRAEGADAEALKAKKEAEATRHQIETDTLKLHRSVEQLTAARDVAQLEYELAQNDVETVQARIQTAQATIIDEQNARLAVADKQAALVDATFDLDRARLQLLSITGELKNWVGVK